MFSADQTAGVSRWPVVRVSVGGETEIVVCADRFLPLTTHWVGRSVVCSGEGCELCDVCPARGLFYLACVQSGRASILELGAVAASHLEQHCKLLHGGIRPGLVVRLRRRGRRSQIHSEVVGEQAGVACVSQVQLASRVVALFHLPGPNPNENLEQFESRLRRIVAQRSGQERKHFERLLETGTGGRR